MHLTDAPDYQDMGGGDRRFKETPPPRSIFGHHMGNALQYEIAQAVVGAGIPLALSGVADETADWGQLKTAIETYVNNNEVKTILSPGNVTVKNGADTTLVVNELIGTISYHKNENVLKLSVFIQVEIPTDTNLIKFELPGDFRIFGATVFLHPAIPVYCGRYASSAWTELNGIYVNMESTSPPLTNMVYISNHEIGYQTAVSVSNVFSGASGGTDFYKFGVNFMFRRADV